MRNIYLLYITGFFSLGKSHEGWFLGPVILSMCVFEAGVQSPTWQQPCIATVETLNAIPFAIMLICPPLRTLVLRYRLGAQNRMPQNYPFGCDCTYLPYNML